MKAVTEITDILNSAGITASAGKYTGTAETQIAVIYGDGSTVKPTVLMGVPEITAECVRIKIRGLSYRDMENAAITVRATMKSNGCVPIGGVTDLDEESDGKMQLALDFKVLKAS
jgi:hypothetical protein